MMREIDLVVSFDDANAPAKATATTRVEAPPAKVWALVNDVERYAGRVPMIAKVKLAGENATMQLKFKISIISVPFDFTLRMVRDEGRMIDLQWVSGEPKGINLRYDVSPTADGAATMLRSTCVFDVMLLGWLAKMFLRHHPEITYGILPGVAIGLVESMKQIAEER